MTGAVALIVAGGRGQRFGRALPKQYVAVAGQPILRWTIAAFRAAPGVAAVHVVRRIDDDALYRAATAGLDLPPPIDGGSERQDSVRAGLESLAAAAPDHVLIHDAARPLVSAAVIARTLAALARFDGAVAATPITDSVKRAATGDDAAATATVMGAVDRAGLWRAQTPQAFRFPAILAAHRAAAGQALTDDAAVAATAGLTVALVAGDEENVKVTTPEDLLRVERLLTARQGDLRVGQGFDVHAFGPGDHVMVCGLAIPHDAGLIGHSDADVGLHAITDAILGALGDGDIGEHFKPSDPRWRGAASAMFLRDAAARVATRGGSIAHVDVTIIGERPRIAPHRGAMIATVAEILQIAADRVSVKATTTERLGFTGRGEGLAAQAVATVRLPFPGA